MSENLLFSILTGLKKSQVTLKVTGDIQQFRPIDVEGFREMLAQQCGEDIMYVCNNGQQEGCVLLYFQVPEECTKHLRSRQDLRAWCLEYGVTEVFVDGEDIVSLPPVEKEQNLKCEFFLSTRKFQNRTYRGCATFDLENSGRDIKSKWWRGNDRLTLSTTGEVSK